MPLIPALCTQCGARLEVDASQEAAVCPYCHTPFITENAINNYNTITNIGNLHADVVNVNDDSSRDSRVKSGETFIMMGDYDSADGVFGKLTLECPYDYRGWWWLIKVRSKNFTDINISRRVLSVIEDYYRKACTVADENEKNSMNTQYKPYYNAVKNKLDSIISTGNQKINQMTNEFNAQKAILEKRRNELIETEKSIKRPGEVIIITIIILLLIAIFGFSITGAVALGGFDGVLCFVLSMTVLGFGVWIVCSIIGIIFDKIADKKTKGINQEISAIENQLTSLDQNYHQEIASINESIRKVESDY